MRHRSMELLKWYDSVCVGFLTIFGASGSTNVLQLAAKIRDPIGAGTSRSRYFNFLNDARCEWERTCQHWVRVGAAQKQRCGNRGQLSLRLRYYHCMHSYGLGIGRHWTGANIMMYCPIISLYWICCIVCFWHLAVFIRMACPFPANSTFRAPWSSCQTSMVQLICAKDKIWCFWRTSTGTLIDPGSLSQFTLQRIAGLYTSIQHVLHTYLHIG